MLVDTNLTAGKSQIGRGYPYSHLEHNCIVDYLYGAITTRRR